MTLSMDSKEGEEWNTSLKDRLLQKLVATRKKILYDIFLDIYKACNSLD